MVQPAVVLLALAIASVTMFSQPSSVVLASLPSLRVDPRWRPHPAAETDHWSSSPDVLCTPVGWPGVLLHRGQVVVAGGCTDPLCTHEVNTVCGVSAIGALPRNLTTPGGVPIAFSGPSALHAAPVGRGATLVRACTILADHRVDNLTAEEREEFRSIYDVAINDLDAPNNHNDGRRHKGAEAARSAPLHGADALPVAATAWAAKLERPRANATCTTIGNDIYVVGGIDLETMEPTEAIDVLDADHQVASPNGVYALPSADGDYVPTNTAATGFSDGLIIIQRTNTSRSYFQTFRVVVLLTAYNTSANEITNHSWPVPGSPPPPTVVFPGNGMPMTPGQRVAVVRFRGMVYVSIDPFFSIYALDLSRSSAVAPVWTSVYLLGSASVLGGTLVAFSPWSFFGGQFLVHLLGGFAHTARGPGAPMDTNAFVALLKVPVTVNLGRPVVGTVGVPLPLTLTSRTTATQYFQLAAGVNCGGAVSAVVTVGKGSAEVILTPTLPIAATFVCSAIDAVYLVPQGGPTKRLGPFYFYDSLNPLSPIEIVTPQTTADATTTATPPTTSTPATTTTAPLATTTTAVANPTAGPASTAPVDHNDNGDHGGVASVPLPAWLGGGAALALLLLCVAFLAVAIARPSSLAARLFRRVFQRGGDETAYAIGTSHLDVVRKIGQGGWGTVYLCRRPGLRGAKDELLAVKHVPCSREVAKALMLREIRVLQSVQGHPNVVRVFEMVVRELLVDPEEEQAATDHHRAKKGTTKKNKPSGGSVAGGKDGRQACLQRAGTNNEGFDDDVEHATITHLATLQSHTGGGGTDHHTYRIRTTHYDSEVSDVEVESLHSGVTCLDVAGVDEGNSSSTGGGGGDRTNNNSGGRSADGTPVAAREGETPESAHTDAIVVKKSSFPQQSSTRTSGSRHRRRPKKPKVNRFLCIVMRYYSKGDLRDHLLKAFPAQPSFEPDTCAFPTLQAIGGLASPDVTTEMDAFSPKPMSPTTTTTTTNPADARPWMPFRPRVPSNALLPKHQYPPAFGDPVPETVLLSLAMQLASTLAHLHNRGILHCDIKPENILIANDIAPKYLQRRSRPARTAASTDGSSRATRVPPNGSDGRAADDSTPRSGLDMSPAERARCFLPIVVTDFGVSQVISKAKRGGSSRHRNESNSRGTAASNKSRQTSRESTGHLEAPQGRRNKNRRGGTRSQQQAGYEETDSASPLFDDGDEDSPHSRSSSGSSSSFAESSSSSQQPDEKRHEEQDQRRGDYEEEDGGRPDEAPAPPPRRRDGSHHHQQRDPSFSSPAGFTLPYLAPEVVACSMTSFTAKSDVWAMGCVVYAVATKQLLTADLETTFMFERVRRFPSRDAFMNAIVGDLALCGYSHHTGTYISNMLDPDPSTRPTASRCLMNLVRVAPLRYVPASAVRSGDVDGNGLIVPSGCPSTTSPGGPMPGADGGAGGHFSAPKAPDLDRPLLEDC